MDNKRPFVTFDTEYLDHVIPIEDMIRRFNPGIDMRIHGNIPCPIPGGRSLHKNGDKTPSATVIHDGNYCYCHACHKGMSVLNYAKQIYGGNFAEVCWRLAEDFGIPLEDCSDIRERQYAKSKGIEFFTESFPLSYAEMELLNLVPENAKSKESPEIDAEMKEYCRKYFIWAEENMNLNQSYRRGLSDETLARFHIGYDPEWENPTSQWDKKMPRLIIPTSDSTYLARAAVKFDSHEDEKRYKCRKVGDIHIFNSEALYNPDKPIFIVEGEIDAMSYCDIGHEATGLGGTGLIRNLAKMLAEKPPTQPLILCQDNDEAGKSAISDLKNLLDKEGIFYIEPVEKIFGNCKDANEALTTDRAAFAAAAERTEAYATIMYERTQNVPQNILDAKAQIVFDDKEPIVEQISSLWVRKRDTREDIEGLLLERIDRRLTAYENLARTAMQDIDELMVNRQDREAQYWDKAKGILAAYDNYLKKDPLNPPVLAQGNNSELIMQAIDDAILMNELEKVYDKALENYQKYAELGDKIRDQQQRRREFYEKQKNKQRSKPYSKTDD